MQTFARKPPPSNSWYDEGCPLGAALNLLSPRWALLVLNELMFGWRRFSEIHKALTGISPNMLAARLAELEERGIVQKRLLPPPTSFVVYELTQRGFTLHNAIVEIARWELQHGFNCSLELKSSASLLMAMEAAFRPGREFTPNTCVQLDIGDRTHLIELGGVALQVMNDSRTQPALTIMGSAKSVANYVFARATLEQAEDSGAFRWAGDRNLIAKLPEYFSRTAPTATGFRLPSSNGRDPAPSSSKQEANNSCRSDA